MPNAGVLKAGFVLFVSCKVPPRANSPNAGRLTIGAPVAQILIVTALSRAKELTGGNAEATAKLGYAWAKYGKPGETRAILAELEDRSRIRYVPSYAIAQLYLALGDRSNALDLLEKAFEERDATMVFLKIEPKWDVLRSESRFIELMKRMNFE